MSQATGATLMGSVSALFIQKRHQIARELSILLPITDSYLLGEVGTIRVSVFNEVIEFNVFDIV